MGGPNQVPRGIVVGGFRILVQVEAGEAPGTFPVAFKGGLRQTEKVEIDVTFTLVELVVALLVFLVDHAQIRELLRDAVPQPLAVFQQLRIAGQQIEKRPVLGRFVEVVGTVARVGVGIAPDQPIVSDITCQETVPPMPATGRSTVAGGAPSRESPAGAFPAMRPRRTSGRSRAQSQAAARLVYHVLRQRPGQCGFHVLVQVVGVGGAHDGGVEAGVGQG